MNQINVHEDFYALLRMQYLPRCKNNPSAEKAKKASRHTVLHLEGLQSDKRRTYGQAGVINSFESSCLSSQLYEKRAPCAFVVDL